MNFRIGQILYYSLGQCSTKGGQEIFLIKNTPRLSGRNRITSYAEEYLCRLSNSPRYFPSKF
jgi:hypothetical protein